MFKKFVLMTFAFTLLTVQANAATHNSLKAAFDDLNYSLTVEWDQADRKFYNSQIEKFGNTVAELQENGLSNQELLDFTLSHIKDQKLARDLETAFNVVMINKMSSTEAQAYVRDVMNKSYNRGASWAGEVVLGAIALVVFVALAAIVAGKAKIEDGCYKVYSCDEDCFGGVCHTECDYRCL